MNNDRRVVITGLGVISPVGNDLETFWKCLKEGKSGIGRITAFDISQYDCKIAGEVRNFDPKQVFKNPKDVRRTDRFVHLAMAAAKMSIGESWRMIKFGDADIFLAGGSEASVVELGLAGFSAMRALSRRNDQPERASRPFDRARDGFVMSEGAGICVVEELEHAKKRGAKIYCELTGYGLSSDAYHMTAPPDDGEGAARAMKLALEHARISPDQVDYINAHATSTDIGDICETRAIKTVFGDFAKKFTISSTKSMTGHLLGGAGGVEMAACALAIRDSVIPPT